MMGNYHVPCGVGEKLEITSNAYLLLTLVEYSISEMINLYSKSTVANLFKQQK